jgi:CBS domain-containing protein
MKQYGSINLLTRLRICVKNTPSNFSVSDLYFDHCQSQSNAELVRGIGRMIFSKIKIRQLMTDKVVAMAANETVRSASILMKKNGVGSVLVGGPEKPVGIVTETDIIHKAIASDQSPFTTQLESIMSFPLLTVEADRSALEAIEKMNHNGIRHLAVTEKGRVVGLISMRDLLRPFSGSSEG